MPGTEQLVQQPAHVLPRDGAALQRGLDAVPYKDKEQGGRGQLLHALHCLLQGRRAQKGGQSLCGSDPPPLPVSTGHPPCHPSLRPLSRLTFMSLRWRYSSMMALDFFSSSSSESAAFGGLTGGRAASRFTERRKTYHRFINSRLPSKQGLKP